MSLILDLYKQFSVDKVCHDYLNKHIDEFIELNDENLCELQNCLLHMLKDINNMCEEFDIAYAITGGNVLGKIRHNGFIPWDDDIDLIMPRKDYEKFKQVFDSSCLQEKYILRAPGYKDGADYRCMKIYKKNTILETAFQKNNTQQKIFIDVMPFDYVPDNKIYRHLKNLWCSFLIVVLGCIDFKQNFSDALKNEMKKSWIGKVNYALRACFGVIFGIIPLQTWYAWYDKAPIYTKKTDYGTVYNGKLLYLDEIVPVDYYLPFNDCDFCGVKTKILRQPENYLKMRYGDYMKIPDKSQRETHIVKRISIWE